MMRKILHSPLSPILVGVAALMLPALIPGRTLYWGTAGLQFIPWRILAFKQLQSGILPLWNYLSGMGAPFLANYQSAFLYPPGWVSFLAGIVAGNEGIAWSFSLLLTAHLAWAGIGMSRLVRRLGMNLTAQVVAGLAFALCGYWVARGSFFSMIWAGSWLPWIVLTASDIANPVEGFVNKGRWLNGWLILCLTMQFLAGHAQLTWYSIIFVFFWVLVGSITTGGWKNIISAILRLGVAGFIAVGLAAIQLLPTAEYLLNSQRADAYAFQQAVTFSFWPWRILTLVMPNVFGSPGYGNNWGYAAYWEDAIYIGLIPFLLALGTLRTLLIRKNAGEENPYRLVTRFSWALIAVTIVLALGNFTPIFPWLYRHIPSFNMFQAPARYMVWLEFSLCLLAGISANNWSRPTAKRRRKILRWMVAAAAVVIGGVAASSFLKGNQASFIPAAVIAGSIGIIFGLLTIKAPLDIAEPGTGWLWLVAGVIIIDLGVANYGLNPTTSSHLFTDKLANETLTEIESSRLYLSSADEYLIKFRRFVRFSDFRQIEDPIALREVELSDINLVDGLASVNNFDPLLPERYSRFMSWLEEQPADIKNLVLRRMNVGLVETRDISTTEGVNFTPVQGGGRVQWRSCLAWAVSEEDVLMKLQTILHQPDAQSWVVVESTRSGLTNPPCTGKSAELSVTTQSALRVAAEINSVTPGWVVLANTWYPDWKAYVDGVTVENLHADLVFQAVHVTAGHHHLEWRYEPTIYTIGLAISGMSLILVITWIGWPALKRKIKAKGKRSSNG